jgi:hypothetical protein
MRGFSFTLILLASSAASAATVYKWVDEKGVTHFSDQPSPGAAKMHVDEPQSFTPPPVQTPGSSASQRAAAPPAAMQCSIDSPANDAVLMNEFSVSGHVHFEPTPPSSAQISLLLDGRAVPGAVNAGGAFSIPQLDRGTHTLSVQVQGADGHTFCTSPSVTFHVRQPSAQAPNQAARPRF